MHDTDRFRVQSATAASLPSDPAVAQPAADAVTHHQSEETIGETVAYNATKPMFCSDRYTAQRFHSRGGEGEVWLAGDERIGRRVAIKRLKKSTEMATRRFIAEAQITGQLEHPGVVPVHDLGRDRTGHPFYAMKFVEGRTLRTAIEDFHDTKDVKLWEREVERRRLLECFLDVCDTIAYAHSRGVLHRDIKPENIMLGPFGETLVLDWGLGKVIEQQEPWPVDRCEAIELTNPQDGAKTRAGSVLGTPAYMPPELADGQAGGAGVTCDVYLLGATLYHLLTGHAPRSGNSYEEMLEMACTVSPLPARKHDREIPPALEAICCKAMSQSPADRYQSALAVGEEVRRHLAGQPVSAYREQLPTRAIRWARSNWQPLKWSLATAALLVPLVFWLTVSVYLPLRMADAPPGVNPQSQIPAQRACRRDSARSNGCAAQDRIATRAAAAPHSSLAQVRLARLRKAHDSCERHTNSTGLEAGMVH